MKTLKLVFGAGLAMFVTPAMAQNMPLSTFLSKAETLNKRGPLALISSDFGLLKREMQGSANALKSERNAAMKAGKTPAYCPPSSTPMSSDEILAHFRAIPTEARSRMTTKDGFRSLMAKKHPCPR
jgi:hypothetical protein